VGGLFLLAGEWFIMELTRLLHDFPSTGVTMFVIPDDVIFNPPRLLSFLSEHRITRMLFTPSLLQAVLDYEGLDHNKDFQFMRCVFITKMSMAVVTQLRIMQA
jgi:acyl-CoA synthetase (AMP-forming)/AMP-acid ligase II